MKPQARVLLLLISLVIIAACGQTGDLYLPEEEEARKEKKK